MQKWNRLVMVLLSLIFLATAVFAVQVNYETTSVSRIVGETPDAMRLQLMRQDFTLESAGVYTEAFETKMDVQEILKSQFGSVSTPFATTWSMSSVQNQLANNNRNYIILNSDIWDGTPYQIYPGKVKDIKNWNLQKSNLFIFDSYAAGLHIKQTETFASALTPKATVIAPLSHTSANFVKAFVCNLGKHVTIGEVFRQARNNYYAHTHQRSEFLGLTMLSYALSGIPTRKITNINWDTTKRAKYCSDYDEVFGVSEAGDYSIQEAGDSFIREITVNFGEPTATEMDGFTVIESEATQQQFIESSLVVPSRTETVNFPLKTVVSNVTLIAFEEPADITAQLPDWNGTMMQERMCYQQMAPATAEFALTQTEDAVTIIAHLNPLEIIDCQSGQFKFYTKARYKIEYVPYSPLRIVSVAHPEIMIPNEITDITVHVENTESSPATGKLVLSDSEGIISAQEITATMSSYQLELDAPAEEGIFEYTVSFMQNDEPKTSVAFDQSVDVLESSLDIPEIATDNVQVALELTNNLPEALPVTVEYELSSNEKIKDAENQSVMLSSGKNSIVLSFGDLEKSAVSYDLTINIPYLESNEMLTGTVVTDRAPTIEAPDVVVKEGGSITIIPTITDPDGDAVSTKIDAAFALDGSHTFSFEESGTYPIKIEASDGILTTEKTIYVVVENVNRAPEVSVMETITAEEGETLSVNAIVIDPDNENSVSNDDNELNMTYGWPLDENGNVALTFEMSGTIDVPITASDGELSTTRLVMLDIANTNRPPRIEIPDTINSDYEIDLAPYVNISDPDNENDDPSDDNQLSIIYATPFDAHGRWTPPQPGLVFTTVKVTDGEFAVGKDVWINVSATHPLPRPPYIYPEYNNTPETPVEEPPANITENQTTIPPANLTPETSQQQNQAANETVAQTSTPALQVVEQTTTNGLEIEITAKGNGRTKKVNSNTLLSVNPDSEVKLNIAIKNNGNTTKKITVEAGIDELDEKEKETIILKPDDDEELKYEFFIPRLTDEDKYKLEISIRENGIRIKKTLTLKLDKSPHKISIHKAKAEACDEKGRITIRLENTGSNNEKGTLHLESKSLGLDRKIPFSLDEGEYKTFSEPFLTESGTHTISLTTEYNSRSITKEVPVENC